MRSAGDEGKVARPLLDRVRPTFTLKSAYARLNRSVKPQRTSLTGLLLLLLLVPLSSPTSSASPAPPPFPQRTLAMDAATLRAQQAPLKEQYQSNPSSARVTLSSSSTLEEGDGAACSLSVGKALKKAGLHAMAGGTDAEQLCSGDMLLEALVACTGVSLKAVATSLEIPVKSGKITAEGDLDFRCVQRLEQRPARRRLTVLSFAEGRWASTSLYRSAFSPFASSSTSTAPTCRRRRYVQASPPSCLMPLVLFLSQQFTFPSSSRGSSSANWRLTAPNVTQINLLIKLTERYCVVLQTLKNAIPCESTVV